MSSNTCDENSYLSNGICCKHCEAGTYKKKDCETLKATQCVECGPGSYLATKNYLEKCLPCKNCNPEHHQLKVKECTTRNDTECMCMPGYYCKDDKCEHCTPLRICPLGQGVKAQGNGKKDIECAPCEPGTYSDVSDYTSPCKAHTRCEDIGRKLEVPGTAETDVICVNPKVCSWMLPAGLWSGLVLTALLLFGFAVFWYRTKRKLYKTVSSSGPNALLVVPAAVDVELELPLPSIELNPHFQGDSYKPAYSIELPPFKSEDTAICCDTEDNEDSNIPITPLKASVSFIESQRKNSSSGYGTSNYLRTFSEPQEDEWCGT